jgi:nicotinamide riboside kinase
MNRPLQIVVTGPECSGKSTLAQALSEVLNEPWVPEYALTYLKTIDRPYHSEDLIAIATGQLAAIEEATDRARKLVVIDTGIEVIDIWHRDKLGPLPEDLEAMRRAWQPDLYLLCKPDLPYEPHPLREDEHRRDELFEVYKKVLADETHTIVSGNQVQRLEMALSAIRLITKNHDIIENRGRMMPPDK